MENYLIKINKSGDTRGDFRYSNHTYSYLVTDESDDSTLIVVLDSTNQVEENMTLVHLSLWMSGVSFAFFVLMVSIFSGRVIEPFIRNYERQRRFITNAGHELKTPLAIIFCQYGVTRLMTGENEWTKVDERPGGTFDYSNQFSGSPISFGGAAGYCSSRCGFFLYH